MTTPKCDGPNNPSVLAAPRVAPGRQNQFPLSDASPVRHADGLRSFAADSQQRLWREAKGRSKPSLPGTVVPPLGFEPRTCGLRDHPELDQNQSIPTMNRHFPQATESADTPFGHVRSAQSHRRWHRATRCEHRPTKDLPLTETALSTTGTHAHGDRARATTSVRQRGPAQNRLVVRR